MTSYFQDFPVKKFETSLIFFEMFCQIVFDKYIFFFILGVVWYRWVLLSGSCGKWVLVICLLVNIYHFAFVFRHECLSNDACIRSKVSTYVQSGESQSNWVQKSIHEYIFIIIFRDLDMFSFGSFST